VSCVQKTCEDEYKGGMNNLSAINKDNLKIDCPFPFFCLFLWVCVVLVRQAL
jgi:hypothetical protein